MNNNVTKKNTNNNNNLPVTKMLTRTITVPPLKDYSYLMNQVQQQDYQEQLFTKYYKEQKKCHQKQQ